MRSYAEDLYNYLQKHIKGNIPQAPPEFKQWKTPRSTEPYTHIGKTKFRFAQMRPRKIISTLAPPHGYRLKEKRYPPYYYSATKQWNYTPSININYLKKEVPRIILKTTNDQPYADYMYHFYNQGADDHSRLPLNSTRLTAPNQVLHNTAQAQHIDNMISTIDQQGDHFSTQLPLPGTVVMPCNVNQVIKYDTLKIKNRVTVDPNWPRKMGNSPGSWCHPQDRLYSTDTTYDTMYKIAKYKAEAFSLEDYERAFNRVPLRPDNVPHNCIRWQWSAGGETVQHYHYFKVALFGHVPTPYFFHLHANALQLLQEEHMEAVAGVHIPTSRQTDDTLIIYPRGTLHLQQDITKAFVDICEKANIPRSADKQQIAIKTAKFNGFIFTCGAFPNVWDVTDVGIGLDNKRCLKISLQIKHIIKGTTFKQAESTMGMLRWASTILPHIRCLLLTFQQLLTSSAHLNNLKPNQDLKGDMQRLLNVFRKPVMVPIFKLLKLSPSQRQLWTDASGSPKNGILPHMGGYDLHAAAPWFFSTPLPEQLWTIQIQNKSKSTQENTTSTCYIELLTVWIMLHTANKMYTKNEGILLTWFTDSEAAMHAWKNQKSPKRYINQLLAKIGAHCSQRNILIDAQHVTRNHNTAADALTHANYNLFSQITGVPLTQQKPVDSLFVLRESSRRYPLDGPT